MILSLKKQRALVNGSSQGIGRAIAKTFAEAGAAITAVARNEKALAGFLGSLPRPEEGGHQMLVADHQDLDDFFLKLEQAIGQHGGFDLVVNNSGGPPPGPIVEADLLAFESALRRHLFVNHGILQRVLPHMKSKGRGRIINIISTSVREPIPGLGVSNTTRAAVAAWAKTLSREVAPFGVTINNILPGFTETDRLQSLFSARAKKNGTNPAVEKQRAIELIPIGRIGHAEEIAAAALFLASDQAAYITGVSLPVDGGRMATLA